MIFVVIIISCYCHGEYCYDAVQVMKVVNDLVKVPELNQTMQQMSKEMMKAGLIEETMAEMMDDAFDTDDIEEDADAEVDKVSVLLFASMHTSAPLTSYISRWYIRAGSAATQQALSPQQFRLLGIMHIGARHR